MDFVSDAMKKNQRINIMSEEYAAETKQAIVGKIKNII